MSDQEIPRLQLEAERLQDQLRKATCKLDGRRRGQLGHYLMGAHALIPKMPQCAFCSMSAVNRCEVGTCRLWVCGKHLIRKFGGHLCPNHRHAVLVQHESLPGPEGSAESTPSKRFRDAGVTFPKG